MIKVQVDKVWLGKVSVRDYIYKKALRKKEKALSIIEILFSKYEKPLLLTKEMEIANDQSASR